MAEGALKRLEEQLNCPICLETYIDPKLLQCHHVYCRKCLVKLVDRDPQGEGEGQGGRGQLILTCPACRHVTPVPRNGVAGLQSAFNITPLLEIHDSFKKIHKPFFMSLPGSPERAVVRGNGLVGGATPRGRRCVDHGEELKLYCETCGVSICFHCIMKTSGRHHSHDYQLFAKAFQKYRREISSSLEPVESQLREVGRVLSSLNACRGEISDQRAAIEADIHHTFEGAHQALDSRKTSLIGRLDCITQGKLKALAVQRDRLESTQAQLSSCLECMRRSVETTPPTTATERESERERFVEGEGEGEVLLMKRNLVQQVRELTVTFRPDALKPDTEADMLFTPSTDFDQVSENFGQVSASGLPDPSKCKVTLECAETVSVGDISTAVLQAVNFNGRPCKEPLLHSSECELVSELTSVRTRGIVAVVGREEGRYQITYQPTVKGRHHLHVRVEGQHVGGSPFPVMARSPVKKLGTPILTLGGMVEPWGVAVDRRRGEVVVADYDGHCISVFSPGGRKLRSFGARGSAPPGGKVVYPRGVTVDEEGNILVVDDVRGVQKFTSGGQFLASSSASSVCDQQEVLVDLLDIAYNPTNQKLYTVSTNNRVHVLNFDLTLSRSFPGKEDGVGVAGAEGAEEGSGRGGILCGVACDPTAGRVYLADSGNHCIQVFTPEGEFLRAFGGRGEGHGELSGPMGVALGPEGMVYVCEKGNHRVSVFDADGRFVTAFGRKGKGAGQFNEPLRLAVDGSGVVYVCDRFNKRVQVF